MIIASNLIVSVKTNNWYKSQTHMFDSVDNCWIRDCIYIGQLAST